ncbi:hypothetical protein GJ496_010414 [Pomphorhynchus laevis]|nr:hypothetical protein GJ496_010414 [Pomphorhynchus laevis]
MAHIISQFLITERSKSWHPLFSMIANESFLLSYHQTTNEAKKSENRLLNRYRDVLPFDSTLVKLKDSQTSYINANFVGFKPANRSYILTQGPLSNTISHFWNMVWQENVRSIIMLNKLVEKGRSKCFQYFPMECTMEKILIDGLTEEDTAIMRLNDIDMTVELQSEIHYDSFVKRNLKILKSNTGETRDIHHYNYTDWPDFGEPSCPENFLRFLSILRSQHVFEHSPVIHCSAGIGRSGTFAFVDIVLTLLAASEGCNSHVQLMNILHHLRNQRPGLIQTPEQLRFCFLSIIQAFCDVNMKINPKWVSEFIDFIEEDYSINLKSVVTETSTTVMSNNDTNTLTTEDVKNNTIQPNKDTNIDISQNDESSKVPISNNSKKIIKWLSYSGGGVILLLLLAFAIYILMPSRIIQSPNDIDVIYEQPCNYSFFCDRKYLHALGKSKAYADSKTIVDLVMKYPFESFKAKFDEELFAEGVLSDKFKVQQIINKYFEQPGGELFEEKPSDWINDPFINKIKDKQLYEFALRLNNIWINLTRKANNSFSEGDQSTFLHMPHMSIVPGGRFREIYYWDSYWTIQGLLACGMTATVKDMIGNMLYNVDIYGFVPNGGRIYYTTRSQPPFLTLMMQEYMSETNDIEFLMSSISNLDKEYRFWLDHRQVKVKDQYDMFQYRTKMAFERPESFWEDHETAEEAVRKAQRNKSQVFIDISSAAESGWDFSSRWLDYKGPHSNKLYSIRTTKIVPVCLNSILCKVAKTLHKFHRDLNNTFMMDFYNKEVLRLVDAIEAILWDPISKSWYDFDLEENTHHYEIYLSNYFPLWAQCHSRSQEDIKDILNNLNDVGYTKMPGGFPTSSIFSTQQWDFPNAWPPLQEIMIEALLNLDDVKGNELAMKLMQKWIYNNYFTYSKNNNSVMYEKYSADKFGYSGEGGEYNVQIGFGWANGVALKYLTKFGQQLSSDPSSDQIYNGLIKS